MILLLLLLLLPMVRRDGLVRKCVVLWHLKMGIILLMVTSWQQRGVECRTGHTIPMQNTRK